jgi:hypothetical protein
MNIITKYNEGDAVYTIDTNSLKVKGFVVKRITTYTTKGETSVTLYDSESYTGNGYPENKCFASEKELLEFITTIDEPTV